MAKTELLILSTYMFPQINLSCVFPISGKIHPKLLSLGSSGQFFLPQPYFYSISGYGVSFMALPLVALLLVQDATFPCWITVGVF